MWFIQPKRDYIAAMPWKHADEPVVMAWQIRVRDYNTFIANLYFVLFLWFLLLWGGLFMPCIHIMNLFLRTFARRGEVDFLFC
ncbi:hypothetical protein HSBAA_55500 [Vreelandella sulfidaeris]|uniref:Uncharacterized protein n=1 Tax=Vreelandella sulfidaeris TaxID=115553 RepID=A0A455UMR7_9GAMM|nr:hypothetical protein HSBAA_55500 [Halomonas sulfidaeris]